MAEAKLDESIDNQRGFLPTPDPLTSFNTDQYDSMTSEYLQRLDQVGDNLPDLIESGEVRPVLRSLEKPPAGLLDKLNDREMIRLCQLSGFFASAYVNYGQLIGEDDSVLPAGMAIPLYETSEEIGRKPILSYDLLCLHNFQRKDPDGDLSVENLDLIQSFTHHDDERWFVIIHVAIEAAAGPAITACSTAQQAVREDDPELLLRKLHTIEESLVEQTSIMQRMTEGNDTSVFANEYRPYYYGFDEIIFEGVNELEGTPQSLRGGSGAQSSILPSIDATLGIKHDATKMIEKLDDMRSYMPPFHRNTITELDTGPDIKEYVAKQGSDELRRAYNNCITNLITFRKVHFRQISQYIREETGDTTGTGGTNYAYYLQKMKEETEAARID
ncbi:indoleamine 2,3-dioxygenase [Natrarchaeobius halalkaliphilus]|uniref:Indoleamine 2,3-dioxygenase n=1 Tax=Natrarchaeobius halalkaliphilus TaxID=1679091 RepID=A0A3N6LYI8_9EURY|nr:indoleamine 2,3-dioxygenase [Natrarchaeobius halalkaliphilus]RQG86802.1 indoleamine 2,3-dioxygenase [Natrarchaeobius halalkaliphilus]